MDAVDRQSKDSSVDDGASYFSKITPLTPTVLLPEIYSDTDDNESRMSAPFVKTRKNVRFTPSVLGNDSDSDSSSETETDRPFRNSLGLGSSSGSGFGGAYARPRRQTIRPTKPVMVAPQDGKGDRNTEIWYPPVE